ncbi:hypothetical protein E4O86_04975 [Rhizobiales bacterium L72]|uniref:Uncharacterized protein n=1 Tax=Propylenella binzhouense TaxID=2555902 RepID=A0A964T242_9HYPH|nr:hypothetical protein [Propylenella binzhouense]
MYNLVVRGTGLPGFPEGHFLSLADHIETAFEQFFRARAEALKREKRLIANVDRDRLKLSLLAAIRDEAERVHGGRQFVDKTPMVEMISAAPTLVRM